ncbi:hypothetical protein NOF04DRAFT_1350705 [Fusarium oxysporum II5]|nr:hypothetical protein NOF04DRAFT_1350705 [Fusarium oxysporum II5]
MTPLFDVKSIESSGETDEQSRGATRQLEDTVTEMRMTTRKTTRKVPTEQQKAQPTEAYKSSGSSNSSDGRAMLQKSLDFPGIQLVHEQLRTIAMSATDESQRSRATVAKTATSTVPLVPTVDTLYCTIHVSRIHDDNRRLAGTIRATVENQTRAELDHST